MLENGQIPSLNGWRAVSVAMVLVAHSGSHLDSSSFQFHLGTLGVRFFFVISGFLITWLLLRENSKTLQIDLKAFFLRRVFRIFPVYYTFLLICYLFRHSFSVPMPGTQLAANLLFLTNYTDAKWVTGHLWTLGVEEQFYVIWPLVFTLFRSQTAMLIRTLGGVVIVCPLIRGTSYLVGSDSFLIFHRFSFLMHADVLALGCLAAVIFWHYPHLWSVVQSKVGMSVFVGVLLMIGVRGLPMIPGSNLISVPLGPTLEAVGFILLMLPSLIRPRWVLFRLLNLKPVAWLGILSYSIYIWHVLFTPSAWSGKGPFAETMFSNPWWIIIAILIASASYYLLEKPFMGLRKRFLTHP